MPRTNVGQDNSNMKRRIFLTRPLGMALVGVVGLNLLTMPSAFAQPAYTVSLDQLQKAVFQRFPLKRQAAGLVEFSLQAPQLRLLPEQNRLGAELVLGAAGPALRDSFAGTFDVDFALRYEASDQTIRAYQLKVNSLKMTGLAPGPSALLEAYAPSLAQQALLEVAMHKLRPQDLQLADTMGLEPSTITVTDKGLVIGFVNKASR
jgi:hypothetical protein